MKKAFKYTGIFLFWILGFFLQLWSFGAIYFLSFPGDPIAQKISAAAYAVLVAGFVLCGKKKTRRLFVSLAGYLLILVWFNSITVTSKGVYPDDLVMPHAEVTGDKITVYDVRDSDYRTKDDYDVKYEVRTYDINDLQTLDLLVNYWGDDLVAHTFLSFGFSDGQYIAVSIEIRPEVGEAYGEFNGLYKQYEIIYIWADERDLIGLRTNYKGEDVYLYRMTFDPEQVKALFLSMIEQTNSLYETPQFYNTATHSCTNTIADHIIKAGIAEIPFWKRRLLTGGVDRRLYNEGWLDKSVPFQELREEALVDQRAKEADDKPDFSQQIRTHLPLSSLKRRKVSGEISSR